MKPILTAAAIALLLGATPSEAHQSQDPDKLITGNEFSALCRGFDDGSVASRPDAWGYCLSYLIWLYSTFARGVTIEGQNACFPDGVTAREVTYFAISYLRRNSQYGQQPADKILTKAIAEEYPCNWWQRLFLPYTVPF